MPQRIRGGPTPLLSILLMYFTVSNPPVNFGISLRLITDDGHRLAILRNGLSSFMISSLGFNRAHGCSVGQILEEKENAVEVRTMMLLGEGSC